MNSLDIRQATAHDHLQIKSLIRSVGINPLGLDWRRFLVAADEDGVVIGCGQIKPHADGSYELASIAVRPGWRRRGVAREIIHNLIASHPDSLYLTCRARLGKFYEKFGFQEIDQGEMPPYFRRAYRFFITLEKLKLVGEKLLVMKRGGDTSILPGI